MSRVINFRERKMSERAKMDSAIYQWDYGVTRAVWATELEQREESNAVINVCET